MHTATAHATGRYADAFHWVLGHPAATRILSTALDAGRVPHAYLFAGPAGVGKTTMAGHLATAILCSGDGPRPCGLCADCGRAAHGNAFNRIDIVPDGSRIKIEQIRSATELMTTGAERGVLILSPVEAMGEQAANALLKTLEEPRQGWVLILVSAAPDGILATIRSRCQVVRFGRLADAQTAQVLTDNGVEAEHLSLLTRLAQGAPGVLLSMGMSGDDLTADFEAAIEVLQPSTLNSAQAIISAADTWGRELESTRRFLAWVQIYASDGLHAATAAAGAEPASAQSDAARWASQFSLRQLTEFILRLDQVTEQLGRNINRPSAIEDLLVMLRHARSNRTP